MYESPASTPAVSAANGAMWGTDAHLVPSKPDAVLRYADHPRGFAELRLPAGAGPFPLAVIFHGGCFKTGIADQAYMSPLATAWQRQGVASLNVDYREVGDGGGWPSSFEDWSAAAGLIDSIAPDYPIDRGRVTLVGHSAGGLPALWLAAAQNASGPVGARQPVAARAALILDGPGDLGPEQTAFDGLCQFSSVAPFMGGNPYEKPERFAQISPNQQAPSLAEVLFVNAALPAPSAATLNAVAQNGARIAVQERTGASHFSTVTPGTEIFEEMEPAMLNVLRGR